MMGKRTWLLSALMLALATPAVATAQDAEDTVDDAAENTDVIYKNGQEINFEGLDVQGEIKKPAGAYLLDRKKSNFSPLISFRQNWDKEAVQSLQQKK